MTILFGILCLLLLIAIGVSLFTYSFFWYENWSDYRRRGREDSGASLGALTIRGILSGIASIILVVVFYPLGFIPRFWKPKEIASAQPVIILVHGLYHNAGAWLILRHRLRKVGLTNIFAMNYSSFFYDFDAILEKLKRYVQRCAPAAAGQPIILIGHSLGGLLSRVYAEQATGEEVPALLITLGTPHRGSKMAAFGIGGLAASLAYEGELFERLDHEYKAPPRTAVSLVSPADGLVLPARGLEPPPGWVRLETNPVSHVGMLYSKKIAGKVIELIKK